MSPRLTRRTYCCVILFVLLLAPALAQAQSTLSGTVFGGGSPLSNAVVEAFNDGTTTVAGSSTTNASGQYSMSLADGTYDLRVSPPSGSGFGQEIVQNVVINGDRIYDVILLAAGAGQVSGVVRGYGGAPVSGASVTIYTANWQFLTSTTTDVDGHYEAVVSGTVHLEFRGNDFSAAPIAPRSWYASRSSVMVTGSATLDITLPVARVTGTVRDQSAAAVSGATVEAYGSSFDSATQVSYSFSGSTSTDASGGYGYVGLTTTHNVTVRPPSGTVMTPLSESVAITGDTTKDFTLAAAILLTGTVRGYGGAPLANASITSYTSNWQFLASATTDAAGNYSVAVSAGTANLEFRGNDFSGTPIAPRSWYASRGGLPVTGPSTLDITLPVARVTGTVRDQSAAAVSGATVEAYGSSFDSATQISYSFSGSTSTDASGGYGYVGLTTTHNVTVRPPSGTVMTPLSESVAITGDTTKDFTLAAAILLTGTVRGYGGAPLANASITSYTSNWQFLASATTDAAGNYSVAVSAGTANLEFRGNDFSGTPSAPRSWYASRGGLPVTGPTTLDISLPVARVDGSTTDSNGAGVPNVTLEAYGSVYDGASQTSFSYSGSVATAASGSYVLMVLKTTANLTVRPPNNSGFLPTSLSPSITGDLTQRIVLQRPDLSPPQITAGPVVVHHSDTSVSISWTTNEPASSDVDYGAGPAPTGRTSTAGFTTNHIVTLTGLSPVTGYQFRVSSSDPSGNGPAYGFGSFTTLASPGDITPPQITAGPTVVFVDQTTAIVQWQTDEPASSSVAFGIGGSLGSSVSGAAGVFTLQHSVTLTGLTPSTAYGAQVTSADPDENSTSSSIFTITTLAEPDTAPPVITAGPTIVSVSDTQIVVEWTTNEPATSGVSYNDGTQFFVVTDNTLSSTHQVTLANLSPSNTYQITVSSTDAVGNGPTLGGPISGTTDAEADTAPPVISNVQVTNITESTAVITFTTSEPATMVLNYGLSPVTLDQTKADLSLSTSHSVVLNGLLDGTQYFFTVQAADGSGNSATEGAFTFTTESSFVDQPPTPPGPITGPTSPSNAATFDLTWGASTDDVQLTGYQVILDGALAAAYDAFTTTHLVADLGEGQHTFIVRAGDSAGHISDSAPFSITIDRTAPSFSTPGHINAGTQGTSAVVEYEVSVSDNLDAGLIASCTPQSGSSFPVGETEVVCTAIDAAGNRGEASFTVAVEDEGAPSLILPSDQTLEATGNGGAPATFSVTASDAVDGAITPACTRVSGSFFALGATAVSCTATDAAGNETSGSFTITVVDTKTPVIASAAPSLASLWPPNHQMVNVSVAVSVSDLGDATPMCRIASVSSNEPINGLGDGDTSPDWMSVSGLNMALRAERSGKGNGRQYTAVVICEDSSGNSSTATVTVAVPKSQK